jgi:aromatic-L-amino-acid decarboxylase
MIRKHVALARDLADQIEKSPEFDLMAPVSFGLVCFRYRPPELGPGEPAVDDLNRELLRRVNATRRVHLTHTELGGRYVIRMAIGQRQTERAHVAEAWRFITEAAKDPSLRPG